METLAKLIEERMLGVGIVLGALFPNKRDFLLISAFVVATAALITL